MGPSLSEIAQLVVAVVGVGVGISQIRKNNVDRTKTQIEIERLTGARTPEESAEAARKVISDLAEIEVSLEKSRSRRGGMWLVVLGVLYMLSLAIVPGPFDKWFITKTVSSAMWIIIGAMYEIQIHNLYITVKSYRNVLTVIELDKLVTNALETLRAQQREQSGGA